jgi:hypothetical protein
MTQIINLIDKKFGYITVLDRSDDYISIRKSGLRKGKIDRHTVWKCRCKCGKICEIRGHFLKANRTSSCGCYLKRKRKELSSLLCEFWKRQ